MNNNKTKAPRKVSKIDGWKAYESMTKEIKQHNQDMLECILDACPDNHIVVVSQTVEHVDPLKWVEGKTDVKMKGIHAFVPGVGVAKALAELSVESNIRRFWYIQVGEGL